VVLVEQVQLTVLQVLLQPMLVVVVVEVLLPLAVLVVLAAVVQAVLVWQLRNQPPVQTELHLQAEVAVVQVITQQTLQVMAATAALAS
jgi:hypothetical protein